MTERASPIRWYIDGDHLVGRQKDAPDERVPLPSAQALAVEGYVALRSKGATHADIVSGNAIPNRVLPTGGASRRVTEDAKWREAIAHAFAEQDTKASFVGVSKEAKEAALARGRTEAAALEKKDVKDYSGRGSVIRWYATLHGEKEPLVRKSAPAELREAAD